MNRHVKALKKKIDDRQAKIGVIGLGYVGLPLAVEFASAGFSVTGIDVDSKKVAGLRAGKADAGLVDEGVSAAFAVADGCRALHRLVRQGE